MSQRLSPAASLNRVQRRVGAIAFFAVTIHGVLGLIGAAHAIVDDGRRGDAQLLVVLSGVVALATWAGVRTILDRPLWAPAWLPVVLAPTVAGWFWLF